MRNLEIDYWADDYTLQQWQECNPRKNYKDIILWDHEYPLRIKGVNDKVTKVPEKAEEILVFNNLKQLSDESTQYQQILIEQYINIGGPRKVLEDASYPRFNETSLPLIARANGAVFEWLSYLSISQLPLFNGQEISILSPLESPTLRSSRDIKHVNPDGVLLKKTEGKPELLGILEYKLNLDRESSFEEFGRQLRRMTNFASKNEGKKVHFSNDSEDELMTAIPLKIFIVIPEDKTFYTKERNVYTIKTPFNSRFTSDVTHATILDMKNQSTASSNRSTNDSSINNFS